MSSVHFLLKKQPNQLFPTYYFTLDICVQCVQVTGTGIFLNVGCNVLSSSCDQIGLDERYLVLCKLRLEILEDLCNYYFVTKLSKLEIASVLGYLD